MVETEVGDSLPGASASNLARVRVYTRARNGERVAMLGLVPRAALEEVKTRFAGADRTAPGRCRLAARVKKIDAVKVTLEPGAEPISARLVVLGFSVVEGPARSSPRSRGLQQELDDLVALAGRIKDTSPSAVEASSRPESAP